MKAATTWGGGGGGGASKERREAQKGGGTWSGATRCLQICGSSGITWRQCLQCCHRLRGLQQQRQRPSPPPAAAVAAAAAPLPLQQQQWRRPSPPCHLSSGPHLVLAGVAADVQEVGGGAAAQLDDVHGCHRQAGAVDLHTSAARSRCSRPNLRIPRSSKAGKCVHAAGIRAVQSMDE